MRTIIFKIWQFPILSETFVLNQIIFAIKHGFNVKILVGELMEIESPSYLQIFKDFNLYEKIVLENLEIPQQRTERILVALKYVVTNPLKIRSLLRYYEKSQRKGLLPLYEFFFYNEYRKVEIFHVQYGTNKHPLDLLKEIKFLEGSLITSFHGHDLNFPINGRIQNDNYYKLLFQNSKYLICNTPYLENKLKKLRAPKEKIKTLPVSVNTMVFKPKRKKYIKNTPKLLKLLTIGRLDELKGQIYGIECIKLLQDSGFNVEYSIGGAGAQLEVLKRKVDTLKLNHSIKFLGALDQAEVVKAMQESDIFLMTSITNAEGMAESQGLVVGEAQACGLPVVAFNSGGIKYTLLEGVTGFLCKEKDVKCFAEKIGLLINDAPLRKMMSYNAVHFVEENFSENILKKKWIELYNNC